MHWIECPVSHGETVHTRLRSWPGLNATSRGGDATHSMHRSAATGGSSALSLFFQCLSSAPLVSLLACMRPRSISFFSFSLFGCDSCLVRIVRCRSTRQTRSLAASPRRMARVHLKSRLGLNAMSRWKRGSYHTRLRLSVTGNITWETGSRLNATSQGGTAPVILCHPSNLQRLYNFVLVHSGDEDILQRGL